MSVVDTVFFGSRSLDGGLRLAAAAGLLALAATAWGEADGLSIVLAIAFAITLAAPVVTEFARRKRGRGKVPKVDALRTDAPETAIVRAARARLEEADAVMRSLSAGQPVQP